MCSILSISFNNENCICYRLWSKLFVFWDFPQAATCKPLKLITRYLRLIPPCWSTVISWHTKVYHFLNLFSILAYFDILFDNIFVWDFHDKFSSMIRPRFYNSGTRSVSMPLISRVCINPVMSFWVGWNTTNLVFVIFNVSLYSVIHCSAFHLHLSWWSKSNIQLYLII